MNKKTACLIDGEKDLISKEQAILMILSCGYSNVVYNFTWIINITGKPFWLAVFAGVLLNIPFGIWIFSFGRNKKRKNVFDIIEQRYGRTICGVVTLPYILLNIVIAICLLNMLMGSVKMYFLETTPTWVITLLIVGMCALFANSGIRNFGWLIEMLTILCIINYFAGFTFSFAKEFRIENFTPIFDTTLSGFIKGIIFVAGGVAEGLLFLMIMVGSVQDSYKHYDWVVKGFSGWALTLSLAVFLMVGNVGIGALSRVGQAGITIARTLSVGQFIRGLEVFILTTYQYLTVIRTTMVLFSCWQSSCIVLQIKKRQWIVLIVLAAIVFLLSVKLNSFNNAYYLSVFLDNYIVLPFVIIMLLVVSLAARPKRKSKECSDE